MTFNTIATSFASEHKVATIKRAYADGTKNVTKLTLQVEGEQHDTYLTVPNASTSRLQLLQKGKRIAYDTSSSAVTEDENGKRYYLDRAAIVTLLNT